MSHLVKIICVSKGRVPSITLNKIYDGFIFGTYIRIIDDNGYPRTYKKDRFMNLSQFREDKLKEIGI